MASMTMKNRFALLLLLLSLFLPSPRAGADPARLADATTWTQRAEAQTDWIQAHYWDARAKRYHPSYPAGPKSLPYDFMWGSGVALTALAAAARLDPDRYKAYLYAFREGLQGYWDPTAPVPGYNAYCSGPGGTDKYYDDNEWMVLAWAEACETTHDRQFLTDAENTQKFVLSGWDGVLGGGIYWKLDHRSKNTCSNGPAAAAALRLYALTGDRAQFVWAGKIRDWLNAHLQDADGLYWDNVDLSGKIQKTKWSYNTALMIRADILFAQLGREPRALDEARRLADAGLAAWTDPATGSLQKTEDGPTFTHLFCESLLRLYDAAHDPKYLAAVRREADWIYNNERDPEGGYYNKWHNKAPHEPGERKSLIVNASVARLFWLLAPYEHDLEPYYLSR